MDIDKDVERVVYNTFVDLYDPRREYLVIQTIPYELDYLDVHFVHSLPDFNEYFILTAKDFQSLEPDAIHAYGLFGRGRDNKWIIVNASWLAPGEQS